MRAGRAAILRGLLCLPLPVMTMASDYQVRTEQQESIDVVRLSDLRHKVEVAVVPGIGNMAVEMKVNGHEILWMPSNSLKEFRAKPSLGGVPFLAPWANRIDGTAYFVNGKKYLLNLELGNVKPDPNGLPIHGLLSFSPLWRIVEARSDSSSAWVTSRLEFWKYPDLMAQFPFAHVIEMTYRLREGTLEVRTKVSNLATEPLPLAIGFHPYFTLDDAPRDDWSAHIAARTHLVLNQKLVPTGEKRPLEFPDPFPLRGNKLDDGFVDLSRDETGKATFWVRGKNQRISVIYGPKFPVAVAYAPPGRNFICFEPMAGETNAFNLSQEGKYPDLQSIAPGAEWSESFWIRPEGF